MESDLDTLAKVQECLVPRPSTIVRGYPIDLEKIVMKALSKTEERALPHLARVLARAPVPPHAPRPLHRERRGGRVHDAPSSAIASRSARRTCAGRRRSRRPSTSTRSRGAAVALGRPRTARSSRTTRRSRPRSRTRRGPRRGPPRERLPAERPPSNPPPTARPPGMKNTMRFGTSAPVAQPPAPAPVPRPGALPRPVDPRSEDPPTLARPRGAGSVGRASRDGRRELRRRLRRRRRHDCQRLDARHGGAPPPACTDAGRGTPAASRRHADAGCVADGHRDRGRARASSRGMQPPAAPVLSSRRPDSRST